MIADQISSGEDGVGDRAWSQQVVNAAIQSDLTGVRFHHIAVVSSTTGGPIEGLQPYYSVEITGRVTVDRNLYDGGAGLGDPGATGWWENYIEKVRNNLPPGCLL